VVPADARRGLLQCIALRALKPRARLLKDRRLQLEFGDSYGFDPIAPFGVLVVFEDRGVATLAHVFANLHNLTLEFLVERGVERSQRLETRVETSFRRRKSGDLKHAFPRPS